MNFARFSVNRPVAVTMRIAGLVLLGIVCFTRLPVDLLPKIDIPTVVVNTAWPNVSPEEIETQVTRIIERAVASVPGLYQISSSSREGGSSVRVQFQWGVDVGQAAVDVLQQVQRARRQFPNDPTLDDPVVTKFDPSQLPILIYAVSGESDPIKLRTLLDNQVAPVLESADGVGGVSVSGGDTRAIIVDVDQDSLRAHNLSLTDVTRRLQQENLNLPAGIAKQGNTEYIIRSIGWFGSMDDIRNVPVGSFNGQLVSLGEVATVRDAHDETRLYTRLNSEPAVGIVITKQSGANTLSTADDVQNKLEQVKKLYPNLHFSLSYDQSQFISSSINNVKEHAVVGGILAILILLFFLRNIRSTLVVALSIPISVTSTFALLYMCGFTLNTMSLGGLALATGLIVDDAVVVLENIFRHIERDKKKPQEAAISGATEIFSAVVASTLTVIVVFLPLLLIKGQSGQMFAQFALVVVFSLSISLLDATTVVPMLASRFIRAEDVHPEETEEGRRSFMGRLSERAGHWFDDLDNSYRNGLKWAIHHRIWIISGAALVTVASFLLVPYIGTEMMPQTDSGDFRITVRLPIGTALAETNKTMNRVEKIVESNPNIQTVFSAAGTNLSQSGNTTSLVSNEGSVTVKLKPKRTQSTQEVIGDLRKKLGQLAGAKIFINQYDIVSQIMGGNTNVEVDIFGDDLATLARMGQEVMSRIRDISGMENVDVSWQEATPELQWKVDRQKSLQMGVNFSDVANTIGTATQGTIASYYQEKGFQYPILVQLPESDRKTLPELMNLVIRPSNNTSNTSSNSGGSSGSSQGGTNSGSSNGNNNSKPAIILQQLAKATYGVGPSQIDRLNRQRYIAVTGKPENRSPGEVQADVARALAGMQMPTGYYWAWGTAQQRRAEEFSGMGLAVVLAICLVYMLLASQFESFVHPLTVLTSVPLSSIGVILALFLTGRAFGLTAFIGLLMLVGIVVKNGILLVDYTNTLRERGYTRDEAILTAGPTRLRPILMTTCATVGGLFLIALGVGEGSETQAPMATAVIGGLLTSTMLTLFIVPTVYTLFDDLGRRFRSQRGEEDEEVMALVPSGVGGNGHAEGNGAEDGATGNGHKRESPPALPPSDEEERVGT
jgi:HAE1 family hydrophobic/amphiphilic exporter-1